MNDSSMQYDRQRTIKILAQKLSALPDSMAWIIERYKEIESLDDSGLQSFLGIDATNYYHLAICGKPRSDLFALDIEVLSDRFNIPEEPLTHMIRRVDTLSTFKDYSDVAAASMLAAARDIAEEPATPYQAGEENPEDDDHDEPKKDLQ
jgi:hypothetical protein